jgi:hypothetical protein
MATPVARAAESMGDSSPSNLYLARSAYFCCGIGALLILGSLVPLGSIASQSHWTAEDSTAYDRISLEYKRAAFQDAGRLGLTEQEQAARVEKLKSVVDAMQQKLKNANQQGDVWSRRMWWLGLATTVLGIGLHLVGQARSA